MIRRFAALSALAAAAALLGCFSKKPPAPRLAPPLAAEDTGGYAGYRFVNKTGWKITVILEDTATRLVTPVDLEQPAQEIHVARILKPTALEMPDAGPRGGPLMVLRLRPGDYRVKSLEARKGRKTEKDAGSGEIFTLEKGLLTYIGDIRPNTSVLGAAWNFSFETSDQAAEALEGIQGRIGIRKQVINLK